MTKEITLDEMAKQCLGEGELEYRFEGSKEWYRAGFDDKHYRVRPKIIKGWGNIIRNPDGTLCLVGLFDKKKDADNYRRTCDRVACIYVEVKEGVGI